MEASMQNNAAVAYVARGANKLLAIVFLGQPDMKISIYNLGTPHARAQWCSLICFVLFGQRGREGAGVPLTRPGQTRSHLWFARSRL